MSGKGWELNSKSPFMFLWEGRLLEQNLQTGG